MRFDRVIGIALCAGFLTWGCPGPSETTLAERMHRAQEETRAGNLGRAKAIYNEILDGYPGNMDALARRGVVLSLLGDGEGAKSDFQDVRILNLSWLDAGVEKDPENADLLSSRARARSQLGRHADAASDARLATEIAPRSAESHFVLGNVLYRSGDVVGAITSYDRAIQLDEIKIEALTARALARASSGDLTGAAEDDRLARRLTAAGYP